jgi:UDP-N-acetylglucosamine--N-acetylmuramyl-(pentapeptide) pyrophosphoryl-undecaprenol N-acetylglucosamine transferase
MKILFTGGGTGGHFYPIIGIAEEVNRLCSENRLLPPEMYYMSNEPYNAGALFDNNITFKKVPAGKMRRYFSFLNFIDIFKTFFGIIKAIFVVFSIYPDVVFGKGGFASFPAIVAARFLRIPVVIHESDTVPGKVNAWAGKFAKRIALSYPEASRFFPNAAQGRIAHTGNPVRKDIAAPISEGSHDFFKIEVTTPVILVLGGSQGSNTINHAIIDALPSLLRKYTVIHQTGKKNITDVVGQAKSLIQDNPYAYRYKPLPYLDALSMRMAAGVANLIISRAGSTIFEIASWGVPSIIIPITKTQGNHQKNNAYAYAKTGACYVIEEFNLTPNILIAEADRIISNHDISGKMKQGATSFVKRDAATLIAKEILAIALSHDK